ncbi:hypothetical protein ElyMa_001047200 [Elysia marginata]|uniref:Uncharacterized protein n=1 Tax=Elysia marginata TaxID=1093978 RepID=A0AAV4HMU3_9GAST|nr:hypothetical protein ElyMa_001047200 [Elysia marginata]
MAPNQRGLGTGRRGDELNSSTSAIINTDRSQGGNKHNSPGQVGPLHSHWVGQALYTAHLLSHLSAWRSELVLTAREEGLR